MLLKCHNYRNHQYTAYKTVNAQAHGLHCQAVGFGVDHVRQDVASEELALAWTNKPDLLHIVFEMFGAAIFIRVDNMQGQG